MVVPAAGSAPGAQSNSMRAPVTPSQTCISWYAWTLSRSRWFQAPILSRNCTDEGVSELHRFENLSAGIFHERTLARSWASTRATRRCDVTGLAPAERKLSDMIASAVKGTAVGTHAGPSTDSGQQGPLQHTPHRRCRVAPPPTSQRFAAEVVALLVVVLAVCSSGTHTQLGS